MWKKMEWVAVMQLLTSQGYYEKRYQWLIWLERECPGAALTGNYHSLTSLVN